MITDIGRRHPISSGLPGETVAAMRMRRHPSQLGGGGFA